MVEVGSPFARILSLALESSLCFVGTTVVGLLLASSGTPPPAVVAVVRRFFRGPGVCRSTPSTSSSVRRSPSAAESSESSAFRSLRQKSNFLLIHKNMPVAFNIFSKNIQACY